MKRLAVVLDALWNLVFGCDICHARRPRMLAVTLVHPDGRRVEGAMVCRSCRDALVVR